MRRVLHNVGMSMNEQLIREQYSFYGGTVPPFALLMPGLARGCHNLELVRSLFEPCNVHLASVIMLLQFGNSTPKGTNDQYYFNACLHNVALSPLKTCSYRFIKQQYTKTHSPCVKRTFPERVQMQTIAVGRAYEWAQHHWPAHQYYVRIRIDDLGWCLPEIHTLNNALTSNVIAVDYLYRRHTDDKHNYRIYPSDRYSIATYGKAADRLYTAWRVWEQVCCTHPCFAGIHNCTAQNVLVKTHSTGECALHEWLPQFGIKYKEMKTPGKRIFRYYNYTTIVPTMDSITVWKSKRKQLNRPSPVDMTEHVKRRTKDRLKQRKTCTFRY